MRNNKDYRLDEIARVDISGVDKKIKDDESPVKLCNFTDVYNNWAVTERMTKYFMPATANENEIKRFSLKKGMVAITKDSETRDDIGMATYIADDLENTVLGYHTALIIPDEKKVDGRYLNAYLNSLRARTYFSNQASGSGQRYTLTTEGIGSVKVPLPEMAHQKRIGKLLSDIDRKIELNNEINDNLYKQLIDLYNYWFIQYDFPNDIGLPYKTNGGLLLFDNTLRRKIPNNWKVCSISSKCVTKLGGTPDTSKEEFWNGSIPWLNSGEVAISPIISAEKNITEIGLEKSATSFSKAGTVLLSITRYIRPSILGFDACYNQSVVAIEPTDELKTAFLYPFFISMIDSYMALRTGAQQPHINKQIVDETAVVIPPSDILNKYYKTATPLIKQQIALAKESKTLSSLRNYLLPLLMNGQATITD